ncbi:hypothetical protein ACFX13_006895 [Malus domestica]
MVGWTSEGPKQHVNPFYFFTICPFRLPLSPEAFSATKQWRTTLRKAHKLPQAQAQLSQSIPHLSGPFLKCTNRKSTVSIPGLGFGDQINGATIVLRGVWHNGPRRALWTSLLPSLKLRAHFTYLVYTPHPLLSLYVFFGNTTGVSDIPVVLRLPL